MKWYTGEIAEAITLSKSKGAIFVVYIEGKDDKSKEITTLIDSGVLGQQLDTDNFVAIKIESGSLPHQQFSEFYKEPSVPSVYFIAKDGTPLDIIKGNDDLSQISTRVDSILSKAGIVATTLPKAEPALPKTEPALPKAEPALPKAEPAQPTETNSNVVCENGVCTIIKKDASPTNEATISSETTESRELTPEEKVQRAKEILEEKRKQKEQEEKEKERLNEIERRKMGQSVQELKRWQKDQEMKQLLENREKEKMEEKLARERVLAQIKQDRAERLSKSQPISPTSENAPKNIPQSPLQIPSNKTRLQFKLPDGSSNTQEFSISDNLQTVIEYIKDNLKLPFSNFKLSTTFPKREFSKGDYSQTLLDLQLNPNAVILILPLNNSALASNNVGSTFTTLLWSLFSPIFSIFDYLKGLIFGRTQNTTGTKRPSDDMGEPRSTVPKKRIMRDSTVVKRQGNIHRLTDRKDSDDEGNTWNGNSTQQM